LSLEVAPHFHAMFCDHPENRWHHSPRPRHHVLLLTSWLFRQAVESSRDLAPVIFMSSSILHFSIDTYISFGTFLIRLGGLFAPKLLKLVLGKTRLFSGFEDTHSTTSKN
jgi:hypothetical protein